ncbi:unnamed protein product [Ectocarpus fasciculatus]
MARKELPQALTLEKFAAGKDGRANAFKKKKQAKKRKLFEKAQLKRQYAKLLKKEAVTARGEHGPEAPRSDGAAVVGKKRRADGLVLTPNRKRREEAGGRELKRRREHSDDREKSGEIHQVAEGRKQEQPKPGKWRRPEHRPDPFKAAKLGPSPRGHDLVCSHFSGALQGVTTRRSFGGPPKRDLLDSTLLVGLVQHIAAL